MQPPHDAIEPTAGVPSGGRFFVAVRFALHAHAKLDPFRVGRWMRAEARNQLALLTDYMVSLGRDA